MVYFRKDGNCLATLEFVWESDRTGVWKRRWERLQRTTLNVSLMTAKHIAKVDTTLSMYKA